MSATTNPSNDVRAPAREDLLLTDPNAIRLAAGELMRRAERARLDVVDFFEFVLRDEQTQRFIKVAPHQRVLLDFIAKHDRAVVFMPPGFAKCHGKGTPILMADGRVLPVEEIGVGDFVMGPSGPRRVIDLGRGRGPLFRIVPVKGESFVCNGDHLLTLVCTDTGELLDVSVNDYLARSAWFQERHKLVRSGVERFADEEPLPVDPYFLGAWFGDGLHTTRVVRMTIVDPEVRAACAETARAWGLNLVPQGRSGIEYGLSLPGGKAAWANGRKKQNPLTAALRELVGEGLSMERVKRAPVEQRRAFLAGIVDTDGSVVENCVTITQKRKDWIDAIVFVARSLGIAAYVSPFEVDGFGTFYRATLSGEVAQLPTRRRRLRARRSKKSALRTGFRVEPLGEGDYYGIAIGGDGRYLLGDFTVTHNTFSAAGITLNLLGQDNTARGLFVSATQEQTKPPISMVRSYIETSTRLRMVYPELRKTRRQGEPWTVDSLTVDRPFGIRTPSLLGVGMDSAQLPGKRINWAVVDDLLTRENTDTKAQRDKVHTWFDSTVLSRVAGEKNGRVLVMNTAWHPDDLLHRLEAAGWPTLRMDILGDITVRTPPLLHLDGSQSPDPWGIDDEISPFIRPAEPDSFGPDWARLRLTAHDPDESNTSPLWPSRAGLGVIAQLQRQHLPVEFNRVYRQICRDDDTALCKLEWIEACKRKARELGFHSMQAQPTKRAKWVVIGLDLAVSPGEEHDDTVFATFEVWDDGTRLLLEIDDGQFDGPTTLRKIIAKWQQYRVGGLDPVIRVENNAAQDYLLQFTREARKDVLVKPHTTGRAKAHPDTGVPAFFIEIQNGAWLFPNDSHGQCHPSVQRLLNACLYYTPSRHTDDALMAIYFAREQAKEFGIPSGGDAGPNAPGLGLDFLTR